MNNDYRPQYIEPAEVQADDTDFRERVQLRGELEDIGRTIEAIARQNGHTELRSFSVRLSREGAFINVTTHSSRFISNKS